MTLTDQQLAVARKLTELIDCNDYPSWRVNWKHPQYGCPVNWPTEGFQVCHEAEKLLSQEQMSTYVSEIDKMAVKTACEKHTTWGRYATCATHEQRLEALCHVWWPERFE